jgi:cell wall-associated NlpC family hydrolase
MHTSSEGDYPATHSARRDYTGIRALTRIAVVPAVLAAGLAVSPAALAASAQGGPNPAVHKYAPAKHARHDVTARPRRSALRFSVRVHTAVHRSAPVRLKRSAPELAPGAKAQRAVQFALAQLGKPYVWGGNGPGGYDCSGLTRGAWRAAGVSIPRRSQEQATAGVGVSRGHERPGDLVIFYHNHSHVGLYVGGGKVVVSNHTGTVIKVMPMAWMPVSAVRRVA